MEFFGHLRWLDGQPLCNVIEPYRQRIFESSLYTFDGDRPRYNLVLTGRGKKNWKSGDLILAGLYRFLVWPSLHGSDCFLLANDEGQAADDLGLAKKLIDANPDLQDDIEVQSKLLVRRDGAGTFKILPAQNVAGQHGKTALFVGFDEIHAYRNWDLLEAMAPDPTRPDTLTWITSYASIFNSPGAPLYDMTQAGKRGADERMFFSWYAADFTTDPDFEEADPEQKANPSMGSWPEGRKYLEQQRRRLPSHKYRRLHLNLAGLPDGACYDADTVMAAIVPGRRELGVSAHHRYRASVDMSGGSGDDATLAIAHNSGNKIVLDLVVSQSGKPPFNPRDAVKKFCGILWHFNIKTATADRYGGQTFVADFKEHGIALEPSPVRKHELYELFEAPLNAGELELLDLPKLQEQALGLVWRGRKIDHQVGEHDDWINAAAGAVHCCIKPKARYRVRDLSIGAEAGVPIRTHWDSTWSMADRAKAMTRRWREREEEIRRAREIQRY